MTVPGAGWRSDPAAIAATPDLPLVLDELARLCESLGLGTYRPDAADGSIFLHKLPPDLPHAAIALASYAGDEQLADAHHGYDTVAWQVWIRGPVNDASAAARLAQRVYDRLHGLRRVDLAGGTAHLSTICGQGGPVYTGTDVRGCSEYSVNLDTELRRVTPNRR